MKVGLLVVGAGLVLAGLAAVGFGIPYKEFSVGGTLIMTGVTAVCTGAIVLGLAAVVRELQAMGDRLDAVVATGIRSGGPSPSATSPRNAPDDPVFPPPREPKVAAPPPLAPSVQPSAPAAPPPWHDEIPQRGGASGEVPPPVSGTTPADGEGPPKRRNLLFSSSRKERDRTQGRAAEPLTPDLLSPELRPNPAAAAEPAPATFDDAWPKAERPRSVDVAPRRTPRPSTFGETQSAAAAPSPSSGHPPAPQEQPPVTVLKSGVVDGMAYSLYSDGSIEAQMPEGMMRFASIDELRSHLEQRP
ncbi:DUF308 domain-containing protein [Bradyrhizobium septentrionale]|uniref:DUF308 domain-containing protein n=1 Tax=Bradyrhizobium septentrionale TaxID=1404411 RepID=A0A974A137_9BRAD|nr:DUF308 domain-containing protein [Bradyrhizobium septentrionale]UGY13061.1 DUF308 domain-containing protein [Bradyrhizobium septentrionale]UGY21681.1 DUF308 domain-containing protein [Bradyrhizobium septentrionale]